MQEDSGNPYVTNPGEMKVAVFDLDGTLTYKDTYVEFLIFCLKRNPWRLLRVGNLLVYFFVYKAGLRTNHWLKARFLKTVASGMPVRQFESLCESFSQCTVDNNLKPKAIDEMQRLKESGYQLVLATASFDFYVTSIFNSLNMDHLLCTKAAKNVDGVLSGEIDGENCIGTEKASRVATLMHASGWGAIERAYSDDRADLPLFEMSRLALVVDPKRKTASLAKERGYKILNWR